MKMPFDTNGKQGRRVWKSGEQEIWVRDLAGGDKAVAVFNRAADSTGVTVKWSDLEMKVPARARDLWAHRDIALQDAQYSVDVPAHGVVLLRVH